MEKPPTPVPKAGSATEPAPSSSATRKVLSVARSMISALVRRSCPMTAAWITQRAGSRPAVVATASPIAMGPLATASRSTSAPPARLRAPATPAPIHRRSLAAFTTTSTANVAMSPSTTSTRTSPMPPSIASLSLRPTATDPTDRTGARPPRPPSSRRPAPRSSPPQSAGRRIRLARAAGAVRRPAARLPVSASGDHGQREEHRSPHITPSGFPSRSSSPPAGALSSSSTSVLWRSSTRSRSISSCACPACCSWRSRSAS